MRRLSGLALATALVLATPLAAPAQSPPFTVTFSGEMRVIGYVWDNVADFTDTRGSDFKDSDSRYFQRWRLSTTVQSADKRAKAVWTVEVGDLTWGTGSSPSGTEYGGPSGSPSSAGRGAGAGLGADGVNVETRHLYVQFDVPGVPGATLLAGAHNILFLASPILAFMDDDGLGVQLNLRYDALDLQLDTVKIDENATADADDNDLYAARLGINVTKDLRLTVEGLVVSQQCLRAPGSTTPCSQTPSVSFGETFWVGSTAAAKLGSLNLDAVVVYGQRQLLSAATGGTVEERGWGVQLVGRLPLGPVQTWWQGWYTTGDDRRIVGSKASARRAPGAGEDFSTIGNTTRLGRDSDKLPVPIKGKSWSGAPFVAEALLGHRTLGYPEGGQALYQDPTGTWGLGGSGLISLSPALSLGAGLAVVGPSEGQAIFGDYVVELDAGLLYVYNPNLGFQLVGSYLFPERGDDGWALGVRTRFAF